MQNQVIEPSNKSEFEVQAFVWSELRRLGINARGEVRVPFSGKYEREKAQCRFDVAVFEDGFMIGIIEIKSAPRAHKGKGGWHVTRQGRRYQDFGVPVKIVYGQEQAEEFIKSTAERSGICWTN